MIKNYFKGKEISPEVVKALPQKKMNRKELLELVLDLFIKEIYNSDAVSNSRLPVV